MKNTKNFKDFKTFTGIIEESKRQRNNAVKDVVAKIKSEFGETLEEFLANVHKKGGVDALCDFIIKNLKPHSEEIYREMLMAKDSVQEQYDDILEGCISNLMVRQFLRHSDEQNRKEGE